MIIEIVKDRDNEKLVEFLYSNLKQEGLNYLYIENLRKKSRYVEELEIIAKIQKEIVMHILSTRVILKNFHFEEKAIFIEHITIDDSLEEKKIDKILKYYYKLAEKLGYKYLLVKEEKRLKDKFSEMHFLSTKELNIKIKFNDKIDNIYFRAIGNKNSEDIVFSCIVEENV